MLAQANFNFINVNSTGLLSKYYGETEENVRELFATARSVAPAVLFFDEFEGLSAKRLNFDVYMYIDIVILQVMKLCL
jgi:SpoVK/Ycf46/Vps4 family AAA+-type ATPase